LFKELFVLCSHGELNALKEIKDGTIFHAKQNILPLKKFYKSLIIRKRVDMEELCSW
jgi:hypothetical protein